MGLIRIARSQKFYDGDTMGAAVSQLLETCDRVISFCYKWTTAYNNILGGPVGMAWSQRCVFVGIGQLVVRCVQKS